MNPGNNFVSLGDNIANRLSFLKILLLRVLEALVIEITVAWRYVMTVVGSCKFETILQRYYFLQKFANCNKATVIYSRK